MHYVYESVIKKLNDNRKMKNSNLHLTLAAELSGAEVDQARTSDLIFIKVHQLLKKFSDVLGNVLDIDVQKRAIGQLFEDKTYVITLGNYKFTLQLINFVPADRWEIKTFRLEENTKLMIQAA